MKLFEGGLNVGELLVPHIAALIDSDEYKRVR
jgi:hypothetical protein